MVYPPPKECSAGMVYVVQLMTGLSKVVHSVEVLLVLCTGEVRGRVLYTPANRPVDHEYIHHPPADPR